MSTLLVKNIDLLATFDDGRREIKDGAIFVRDNVIEAVGASAEIGARQADETLDLSGHVVMPGMVNIHHHMYQTLTRVMVQDDELLVWLKTLYPIWAKLDDEAMRISAGVAMAELIQSGCTTTSDHLYILPNNSTLDSTIEASRAIGMRFHAARGSMSVGRSQGGLPPDGLVEDERAILADTQRVIEAHHDKGRFAMLRVAVAIPMLTETRPCGESGCSISRSAVVCRMSCPTFQAPVSSVSGRRMANSSPPTRATVSETRRTLPYIAWASWRRHSSPA